MVAFLYACDQEHGLICRMLIESGEVDPFTVSLVRFSISREVFDIL
jgi:hypothetical protein